MEKSILSNHDCFIQINNTVFPVKKPLNQKTNQSLEEYQQYLEKEFLYWHSILKNTLDLPIKFCKKDVNNVPDDKIIQVASLMIKHPSFKNVSLSIDF